MKYLIIAFFALTCTFLSSNINAQNDCFSISPNPIVDSATITWDDASYTGELHIIIYDITGKQIEEMIIDRYDKPFVIDVTTIESGLYIIHVISDDPLALCNSMKIWIN